MEQLKFTGERYIPDVKGDIELEHLHRYKHVCEIVTGLKVLDIACGEGYGSYMIAHHAQQVIGIDLSADIIEHASQTYQKSNLNFIIGDCRKIPVDSGTIDVVVSFETIEHHTFHEEMMAEIKRILTSAGVLIISSPDKDIYSTKRNYSNPFHQKELSKPEFISLLEKNFKNIQIFNQRILYGSAIFSEYHNTKLKNYHLHQNQGYDGIHDALYLIGVASDREIPELASSVFEKPILESENYTLLLKKYNDQQKRLYQTEKELETLNEDNVKRGEWGLKLDQELLEERERLNTILTSWSWRITSPIRIGLQWVLNPRRQFKNIVREFLFFLHRVYHIIPLNPQIRKNHKIWLDKNLPMIMIFDPPQPKSLDTKKTPPYLENIQFILKEGYEYNANLEIHTSKTPKVSVIIPVYGKEKYTLNCLESISINQPTLPFEIIIIDDDSPGHSWKLLQSVKGIQLIKNKKNKGFIESCNLGAKIAKGEYLYFLNNDTLVTKYWMEELYNTFCNLPNTGLVGSKLIYPDGSLQEAGGIIWKDGSAWNFGKYQDSHNPTYEYLREVDYCSGASIMIPKNLFLKLGGFDEIYKPAYCEDADIALKIRQFGYRVLYQPKSIVIHLEGITSGTDLSEGVKSFQVANTKKLYERWNEILANYQSNGQEVDQAKDRSHLYRVLYIDATTPTPDMDSGSIDAFNHMIILREMGFQVTFIPHDNYLFQENYTEALQKRGIECLYQPYIQHLKEHLIPNGYRYDLIFIARPIVFENTIGLIKKYCKQAKILFHTVDLHHLRMKREAEVRYSPTLLKEASIMETKEFDFMNKADQVTVLSTEEYKLVSKRINSNKLSILPYSRSIKGKINSYSKRHSLLFIGSFQHMPNVDGMVYFVNEIMPMITRLFPKLNLYIVGSNVPQKILKMASKNVIIKGYVKDLEPILEETLISVAPLRYGAGIKGKIGTALAAGIPVIATSIAAEGMKLKPDENILIANDPSEFVDQLKKLMEDETLWNKLSENGLKFAKEQWGPKAGWNNMKGVLEKMNFNIKEFRNSLKLYD